MLCNVMLCYVMLWYYVRITNVIRKIKIFYTNVIRTYNLSITLVSHLKYFVFFIQEVTNKSKSIYRNTPC